MKHLLTALLFAAASPLAIAAPPPPPPVIPDAGSILRQVQPVVPLPPSSSTTGLTIEQESGTQMPQTRSFQLKSIQIVGNTAFDTETLHTLVADAEGTSLTLVQLHERVARITDYYQRHGYPLARAIIPQQVIDAGIVRIEIIEARYGKISLENTSRVHDSLLLSTLSPLQGGQAIGQRALDHALLLLSDVPGAVVNGTLKPGEAVGTSDLVVNTSPGATVAGNMAVDNFGNRYTGRARLGGDVNFIDPLHLGDVLSVSGLTSGGDMNYGRVAYESVLNGEGTRLGVSYSALHYRLGDPLSSLDAHGTAQVESIWLKHPLVRSADWNLYGQFQYDHLKLDDHIDASAIKTDRHLDDGVISLIGDARDTWLSGGVTSWNVSFTSGAVGFDNGVAQAADAATVQTEGHYVKWNASVYHLQNLSATTTLYLAWSGQWANENLDSSQQMIAGGPHTVRAYDMGTVSGDTGNLETAEIRRDLGSAWQGRWQALAFIDSEQLTINKHQFVAGTNSVTLSGVGLGLRWAGPAQWVAQTYLATHMGPTPSLVESPTSVRLWVEISKGF
jgi:hemolysin activation/secretion protein